MLPTLYECMQVFAIAFTGSAISIIACSRIYRNMRRQYGTVENRKPRHKLSPNERFLNSWKLPNLFNDIQIFKDIFVDEKKEENYFEERHVELITPNGLVIMQYNPKDNVFEYWSDKSIPYSFLQVVMRCYVIVHECNYLYLKHYHEEFNKSSSDSESDDSPDISEEESYLFLRRNGKEQNQNNIDTDVSGNETTKNDDDKQYYEKENEKRYFVFRKISTISDYKLEREKDKTNKMRISNIKNISYSDFKQ